MKTNLMMKTRMDFIPRTESRSSCEGLHRSRLRWRPGVLLVACLLVLSATLRAADPTTTLIFNQSATGFHESLPLGNGRLGAMVFGGVDEERIVLNESSVWSGSTNDDNRLDAHKALPEIRRLLLEGKNVEAEARVNQTFTCQSAGSGHGSGSLPNLLDSCAPVAGLPWPSSGRTARSRIIGSPRRKPSQSRCA
jgi:hypothetical protein